MSFVDDLRLVLTHIFLKSSIFHISYLQTDKINIHKYVYVEDSSYLWCAKFLSNIKGSIELERTKYDNYDSVQEINT